MQKVDCTLACIARGRAIIAGHLALGVFRSNVLNKKTSSSYWADLRKSPPKDDIADLVEAIAYVVKDRATYGYRRVWARLKMMADRLTISGFTGLCAMRDE
jgi:hypothetical protein